MATASSLSVVPANHWVISSQTCTIANEEFASLLPAYEEQILLNSLTKLGVRQLNPPDAIRANKKPWLLALENYARQINSLFAQY